MRRNLDMTALRSFVAVAQTGGVTRAASGLNLTQSAVSMQMKRLEESLGLSLFDRSGRGIALTAEGDQLLSYARRILALNDEVVGRMTAQEYEGEITLGVPHDIVYPFIPQVMRRFAADFPRMRVNLLSSWTTSLRDTFVRGECAMILTTEEDVEAGGETLAERQLVWIGAPGGQVWRSRPLRLAFERHCVFRTAALRSLDQASLSWEMAVESDSGRTIEATVSADMAISAVLEGAEPPQTEPVSHAGALPDLKTYKVNLYVSELAQGPAERALADMIRDVYGQERLRAA